MAAMRSALQGLCRRSYGNCGSSAAASMVGRGLGTMRQGVGAAEARTAALRPAAARNLEGLRHFSTEGMEGADRTKPLLMEHKAESILRTWWQRSRDSVRNVIKNPIVVGATIGFTATMCLLEATVSNISDTRTKHTRLESPMPMAFSMIPGFRGIYFNSLRSVPDREPVRHDQAMTSLKMKDTTLKKDSALKTKDRALKKKEMALKPKDRALKKKEMALKPKDRTLKTKDRA